MGQCTSCVEKERGAPRALKQEVSETSFACSILLNDSLSSYLPPPRKNVAANDGDGDRYVRYTDTDTIRSTPSTPPPPMQFDIAQMRYVAPTSLPMQQQLEPSTMPPRQRNRSFSFTKIDECYTRPLLVTQVDNIYDSCGKEIATIATLEGVFYDEISLGFNCSLVRKPETRDGAVAFKIDAVILRRGGDKDVSDEESAGRLPRFGPTGLVKTYFDLKKALLLSYTSGFPALTSLRKRAQSLLSMPASPPPSPTCNLPGQDRTSETASRRRRAPADTRASERARVEAAQPPIPAQSQLYHHTSASLAGTDQALPLLVVDCGTDSADEDSADDSLFASVESLEDEYARQESADARVDVARVEYYIEIVDVV
jgi:hypothetical protein